MRSSSAYSQPPQLLQAFAPQFKTQHYHIHGRNVDDWETVKSIFLDQHHTVNRIGLKVMKGALLGYFYGFVARNFVLRGPKSFQLDRLWILRKGSPIPTPLRGYTAFGALMGAVWWLIKDYFCVPHGEDTYWGHIKAYGLMGGVLISTLWNPANFVYGFLAGGAFGAVKLGVDARLYPRGMEWKIKNTDEQRRRRLLREDEEWQLSNRNVLTTRHNLYPL